MTILPFKALSPGVPDIVSQILGPDVQSRDAYRAAMARAIDLSSQLADVASAPYSGASANELKALVDAIEPCPTRGTGVSAVLDDLGKASVMHALHVGHQNTVAHLHCPVAIPALAAEVLIAATNQSLDSWDQSPFATMVEERVIGWLVEAAGLPAKASGSFTSGGSQSNMTALHLAAERCGLEARRSGLIFTSEHAHFSIAKSARILGFGEDAVVTVKTDGEGRMCAEALARHLDGARMANQMVVAIVATAGTTDLGAIDPLDTIADIAEAHGVFLHVDAAYGGGLLFSRHRGRLKGLERAQSVALDFHKMLFQPISSGVLLVADRDDFLPLAMKADYLNPEEAVFPGVPNLVERSFQTTRRADALKVLVTTRALGRDGLDQLISRTLDNAVAAAAAIDARTYLELARHPSLSTVVFRYISPCGVADADEMTMKLRAHLFEKGVAALATTVFDGRVHFKLTLLNPRSTPDVVSLLGMLREELQTLHQAEGGQSALVEKMLASSLLTKGNLRTRFAQMDELVGPLETQSVYLSLDNPLAERPRELAYA